MTQFHLTVKDIKTRVDSKTSVRWMRSRACPELDRVWFARLIGSEWTTLGAGKGIPGGWELSGLSLPANTNIYIRARGDAKGGRGNASTSVIESDRLFYLPATLSNLVATANHHQE